MTQVTVGFHPESDCLTLTISEKLHIEMMSDVIFSCLNSCFCLFSPQVLGFEVDSINSVQFSNHTGWLSTVGTYRPAGFAVLSAWRRFVSECLTCPLFFSTSSDNTLAQKEIRLEN